LENYFFENTESGFEKRVDKLYPSRRVVDAVGGLFVSIGSPVFFNFLLVGEKLLNLVEQEDNCDCSAETNALRLFGIAQRSSHQTKPYVKNELLPSSHVEVYLSSLFQCHIVPVFCVLYLALGEH